MSAPEKGDSSMPSCSKCGRRFDEHGVYFYAADVPASAVEGHFPGLLVRGAYCPTATKNRSTQS